MLVFADGKTLPGDDYVINEVFSGINTITFRVPDEWIVHNEDVVYETIDRQEYLVKIINGDKITAELNLDGLKSQQMDFDNNSASAGQTVTKALIGTGWTCTDQTGLTSKRTITGSLTPLDVIKQVMKTWDGVTAVYDTELKSVTLVYPAANSATATFLTEDLNLRQLDVSGKSSTFCTRLRAKGKDGMTFASINGGKDYVENYTYSDKIIYGTIIEDERFSVKESLKEYAQAKLDQMAVPSVSYECTVVDVAAYDSAYNFLQLKLHKAVWLLDKRRNQRVQHRVVNYERHPAHPENNKVTLATVVEPLQNTVKSIEEMLSDPNSEFIQKIEIYVDNHSDDATSWLLGAKGGNVIFRKNDSGQPEAIIIADGLDINTAQNVWLWNVNGLGFSSNGINGPYTTAITSDGKIVADFIKAGTIDGMNVTVKNLNADKITAGTLNVDRIASQSIGGGKIASNAIVNRHMTSGSIRETTCDSTIQGYFADAIYAANVFAGTAVCDYVNTKFLSLPNKDGVGWGVSWLTKDQATYVLGNMR